jgi:glycine/D-amino acid oxidase-like deaminating enzyme/nitrite reductase/ring-hydroxylating ferredoxin subunit
MDNVIGTTSLWAATATPARRPALTSDLSIDICVVGAGIAGLTTAYLLAREGRSVAVLEGGSIGGGETGRTTAHLGSWIDDTFQEIERLHGERGARLAHESHAAAIDRIESIVSAERIACDFARVDGFLFLASDDSADRLDAELGAAKRAGFHDVARLEQLQIDGFDLGPCLRFPRQGQLHALRYVDGLAHGIEARGGRIFTETHVNDIQAESRKVVLSTAAGTTVEATRVVVATNTPFNDRFVIHTKQAAYRTYALAARVPAGSVPRALYWDTGEPYHYVRLQPAGDGADFLIAGGEDHKTGQDADTAECYSRLEDWARQRFSAMGEVEHRWSGQVMEPVDGLAFIGQNPADEDNVYVVTGDSGMGMTHGTIAGILLTDLIEGRENEWKRLYDPRRKTLSAAKRWLGENLNVAAELLAGAGPAEVSTVDEIPRGGGAVVRRGLQKIAVYRDERGALHERSAVCPHLGCVVAWNESEKSWDCPCHGSRFDPHGRVVNGPAAEDLAAATR